MDDRDSLRALHHSWAQLAALTTIDQDIRRSLKYFHAEVGSDGAAGVSSRRIANWISVLFALETFIESSGRLPHRNARKTREEIDPLEERLANWVRQQRRSGAGLCTYQRERLECVPDFSWAPNDDAWDDQLRLLKDFVAHREAMPLLGGETLEEQRLARWARTQVARNRRGVLEKHRTDELSAVCGWRWQATNQHQ